MICTSRRTYHSLTINSIFIFDDHINNVYWCCFISKPVLILLINNPPSFGVPIRANESRQPPFIGVNNNIVASAQSN
jgi:hypothetical protein